MVNNILYATDTIMVAFAGIKAFSMVQLFNWFPKRYRGTVMAVFVTMETFGFVSQFFGDEWWPFFPLVPYAQEEYLPTFGIRHIIAGSLYLVTATVDYFSFYNYPMQRCIIVAHTERSQSENNKLLELA